MSGGLDDHPFAWKVVGDEVHISHLTRRATILRGAAAGRFLARVEKLAESDAQHLMARVTGNFKRGNERR